MLLNIHTPLKTKPTRKGQVAKAELIFPNHPQMSCVCTSHHVDVHNSIMLKLIPDHNASSHGAGYHVMCLCVMLIHCSLHKTNGRKSTSIAEAKDMFLTM